MTKRTSRTEESKPWMRMTGGASLTRFDSSGCGFDLGCDPSGTNVNDSCGGRLDTDNRIYFTSQALNDDGDYVHFLVYESIENEDSFYFGFEDLFRGGDNAASAGQEGSVFSSLLFAEAKLGTPCVLSVIPRAPIAANSPNIRKRTTGKMTLAVCSLTGVESTKW